MNKIVQSVLIALVGITMGMYSIAAPFDDKNFNKDHSHEMQNNHNMFYQNPWRWNQPMLHQRGLWLQRMEMYRE